MSSELCTLREEEELKRIPYEDEQNLCEHLTTYLRTLQSEVDSSEATSIDNSATNTGVFSGMKVLTRSDDDFLIIGGNKGKGKKKGGKNNAKKDAIVHSIDTLNSFSLLQISPPNAVSQIPDTLEALKAKKLYFKGIERGSVPTIAEIQKSRASSQQKQSSSASSREFTLEADFPALAVGTKDSVTTTTETA